MCTSRRLRFVGAGLNVISYHRMSKRGRNLVCRRAYELDPAAKSVAGGGVAAQSHFVAPAAYCVDIEKAASTGIEWKQKTLGLGTRRPSNAARRAERAVERWSSKESDIASGPEVDPLYIICTLYCSYQ